MGSASRNADQTSGTNGLGDVISRSNPSSGWQQFVQSDGAQTSEVAPFVSFALLALGPLASMSTDQNLSLQGFAQRRASHAACVPRCLRKIRMGVAKGKLFSAVASCDTCH